MLITKWLNCAGIFLGHCMLVFLFLFVFLTTPRSLWDLVSPTRELNPGPWQREQGSKHWTTREFPVLASQLFSLLLLLPLHNLFSQSSPNHLLKIYIRSCHSLLKTSSGLLLWPEHNLVFIPWPTELSIIWPLPAFPRLTSEHYVHPHWSSFSSPIIPIFFRP